jgi:SRSO17 transposase
MFQMSQKVVNADNEKLQNFISDSKWSAQAVMDRVAQQVNQQIGDPNDTALLIDESGILKKGEKSAGVARQWLGSVGKVDNGQVGVFAALSRNGDASLINARLYLPGEWIDDPDRCCRSGIPKECQIFKTKDEIALEMVKHARKLNLDFGWVGADAGYGKGITFMKELHRIGETFMVDIHSDFRVYLKQPKPYLPSKDPESRGRTPTRYLVDQKPVSVTDWIKRQPTFAWKKVDIREGTKGVLQYEVLTERIWVWEQNTENYYHWTLVVRRNPVTKTDVKYSFCNSTDFGKSRLAYMQSQRYWIERTFNDAKSECGMADYEVRGWNGWHHHMALVLLAQSFMLDERILNREEVPLLSCADLIELLSISLPSKINSVDDVAKAMEMRHRKRQAAIDSATNCQCT